MTTALITNDDGVDSPGLHELACVVAAQGLDVVIAAPSTQSSGSSASIMGAGEDGTVGFERREIAGLDMPAFAVRAAPALISLVAAHGAFGPVPDVVFSGINRGANVGRAILHSGTVGAALTAGVNGARGMAVSLDVGLDPLDELWSAASQHVARLLPLLMGRPVGAVFNLNVPNSAEGAELREGPLASFGIVQTITARAGEQDVRLTVADTPAGQDEGSDAALLHLGFATVTEISSIEQARAGLLTP